MFCLTVKKGGQFVFWRSFSHQNSSTSSPPKQKFPFSNKWLPHFFELSGQSTRDKRKKNWISSFIASCNNLISQLFFCLQRKICVYIWNSEICFTLWDLNLNPKTKKQKKYDNKILVAEIDYLRCSSRISWWDKIKITVQVDIKLPVSVYWLDLEGGWNQK